MGKKKKKEPEVEILGELDQDSLVDFLERERIRTGKNIYRILEEMMENKKASYRDRLLAIQELSKIIGLYGLRMTENDVPTIEINVVPEIAEWGQ